MFGRKWCQNWLFDSGLTFLKMNKTKYADPDPAWYWPDPDPDPTSQNKPDPDPDPDTSVLKIFHLFYDEF